jgi:hypothetical protein
MKKKKIQISVCGAEAAKWLAQHRHQITSPPVPPVSYEFGTGVVLLTTSGGVVVDVNRVSGASSVPYLDETTYLTFGVLGSALEDRFGPWEQLPTNEMLIVMASAHLNQELDGLLDRCDQIEIRLESRD